MQLIDTIQIDLAVPGIPPRIYAKQDDSGGSRAVRIELYHRSQTLTFGTAASFMVRYKTAQGRIGLYDTMPDGTNAVEADLSDGFVIVSLVDQIFAMPGDVECELRIITEDGAVSTWTWIVSVQKANVGDATIPSDYINVISNLASTAVQAAAEAKDAASRINPASLMKYSEYDPSGAVKSSGGIVDYVSKFDRKTLQEMTEVAASSVYGANVIISDVWVYTYGEIASVSFTLEAELHSGATSFSFSLTGLPLAYIVLGHSNLYASYVNFQGHVAGICSVSLESSGSIIVIISPNKDAWVDNAPYFLRIAYIMR